MSFLAAMMLGYIALALQVTLAQHLTIGGARPDLAIVATVIAAWTRGPSTGVLVGFLIGLGQDLTNPTLLGANALANCALGYGVGHMRSHYEAGTLWSHAWILLVATLAHDLVYLTVYTRLALSTLLRELVLHSLPSSLYTALVGMWLLALAASLSGRKGHRLGRSSLAGR
jgi:rod shape-determining protein MreD